jgi:molybdopterin converting factor small subunit
MKAMGRKPDGLEKIKIQQEAVQRFKDMNKVVDMEGNVIDTSKGIMGGQQVGQKGMFDNIFARMQSQMGKNIKEVKDKNRPGVFGLDDYDISNMSSIKKEIIKTEQKLGNLNPDSPGFREKAKELSDKIIALKNKMRDDKAMGGRIGLKEGEGIMQMASMDDDYEAEFMKLVGKFMEQGFNQQEAIDAARDELERLRDKFTSAPDPMDERNTVMENIAISEFGRPLKDLDEDQIRQIEEMMEEMTKVDRGAPSITLAEGGRAAFKEGLRAKLMTPFKIDRGTLRSMFFNKNNPIITGLNTSTLFDTILPLISSGGFAEGGRIGYKDGPEKPSRRTFMKAAAGLASLLPFGIGKVSKVAAPVVTKAAEITGPALAKIVDTVMSLGKLVSVQGKRVKEMVTKKKHQGVEVTEDIQDGSYVIKKGDKEIYYKPGRQDESGGFEDDIIEVIEKRIEKAGGGIGYMLGE